MRKYIALVLASLCVLSLGALGACAPKAPPPTPIITK
jgi:hypothetical protein